MKLRRFGFLMLLLVVVSFAQNAPAALLPVSSYEDGRWQGTKFYYEETSNDGFLSGTVNFAVYDTRNLLFASETDFANDLDMDGRFIYAYQIFNDAYSSSEAVASFAVFAISGKSMSVYEDSIGSKEDTPDSGTRPAGAYFTELDLEAVWTFAGEGILAYGAHSWFLVFSSDYGPVRGDYRVSAESGDFAVADIPEPGTVVLLGFGGLLFLKKKCRKSVR